MTGYDIARNGASRLSETRAQVEGTVGSWSQACIKILQYSYRSPACPPPDFSTALVACPPVHLRLFGLCNQAQIHTETTHICQPAAQRHCSQSLHLRTAAFLEFIGFFCRCIALNVGSPRTDRNSHLELSPTFSTFLCRRFSGHRPPGSLPCNHPVWKACYCTVLQGAYISYRRRIIPNNIPAFNVTFPSSLFL